MEDESNNLHMTCFSSTADSEWVAQNVQEVNQSMDCMLKIIQEDEGSASEEADTYHKKRLQLASLIDGINQKHQLLAAQCDRFIEVLQSKGLATPVQNFGQKQKLDMQKIEGQMVSFDCTPSPGSSKSSFEVSASTGSGFSSLLSSDSLDSFNLSGEKHLNSNGDKPLQNDDDIEDNLQKDGLLKELEITKAKLKASEDEVSSLKSNISNEFHQSTSQLQSQLELHEKEMNLLKANLDSEKSWASDLQGKITGYTTDIAEWEFKTSELTASLQEALRNSEAEKAQLLSHNSVLSANMIQLEAKYAESEVKIKLLEKEIKNSEALKEEMKDSHHAQEMQWHKMEECLKAELNEKNRNLEALNKNFDGHKLKFDMLMAEKDGLNAKLQTLHAELCSKDIQIQQSEYQLQQLQSQNAELNASTDSVSKQKDELRLKVEELEKELKWQAVMISDRAEEKKEAIRQLCFSIEHYRSGYQELRKAYTGKWRRVVTAS